MPLELAAKEFCIDLHKAEAQVAFVPSYLCTEHIENGELVRLLPEWIGPAIQASVVTPLAPSSSARLKLTVDCLHSALSIALK